MTLDSFGRHRRDFLQIAGAAGLAAVAAPLHDLARAADRISAAKLIKGKHANLKVLSTEPLVFETPLELLDGRVETPTDLLFVRNNQQLAGSATMQSIPLKGWTVALTGLLNKDVVLQASDLASMPQVEHAIVLQCSGNGRSLYSVAAKTKGTQWGLGGVANVRFSGVPVADVLRRANVKIAAAAKFVTAEGRDKPAPGKEDFEHSIPLDDVLSRSFFAFKLNGKPLSAIHGGPVRLITPGFFATMNVKWLSRLRFEKSETKNYNQVPRYRTPLHPIKPGTEFNATLANSTPTWKMKLACIILSPRADAALTAGANVIRGVAFNDGAAAIETVLVSLNRGATWHKANLKPRKGPFAWTPWTINVKLATGKHQVWARAIDALGRSQPLDGAVNWNPRGYEWNGVAKVSVRVS